MVMGAPSSVATTVAVRPRRKFFLEKRATCLINVPHEFSIAFLLPSSPLDYYFPTIISQEDVDAGVCLYSLDQNGDQTNSLLSVDLTDIGAISQGTHPNSGACQRCATELNFSDDDGKCVCTPNCGSCASDTAEDHDPDLSGAVCLDLSTMFPVSSTRMRGLQKITASSHPESTFVPCGSVRQGSPYSYSPQCGFGRTYRSHKRGGRYTALPADFPTSSVAIVNLDDFSLKCQVELGGSVNRVVYVPPTGSGSVGSVTSSKNNTSSGDLTGGAIAGIVVATVAVVGIVAAVVVRKNKSGQDKTYTESEPEQY